MDNIINMLNKLIDNNPLESIEKKNKKIKELENNMEIEKIKEITKQKELDIKQKELDIKQKELDNEKIKMEIKK